MVWTPRQSRMLGTSDGSDGTAANIVTMQRKVRTSQPQQPAEIDRSNKFGKYALQVIVGNQDFDLASGKPLIFSGSTSKLIRSNCIGHYNGNITNGSVTGDIATPSVGAFGGSAYLEVWVGFPYGSHPTSSAYLCGAYNGTIGTGISAAHTNIGGRWGYFNGVSVIDSGESIYDFYGKLTVLVAARTLAGSVRLYRNGKFMIKDTCTQGIPDASWAVGSLRQNGYGSFGNESVTALAFRSRYCEYSDAEIKELSANPWQIFAPKSSPIWVPV